MRGRRWIAAAVLMLSCGSAVAQMRTGSDYAWTPVAEQEGLAVSYIYYGAGEHSGGIVLRLRNLNDRPVAYRFVVMIRAGDDEFVEEVTGTIAARADKTGGLDGLYWAPFARDRDIGEIGFRGLRVTPVTRE